MTKLDFSFIVNPSHTFISYTGATGVLWSIVWFLVVKDSPADDPRLSQEEREYIESNLADDAHKKVRIIIYIYIYIYLYIYIYTFFFPFSIIFSIYFIIDSKNLCKCSKNFFQTSDRFEKIPH